MKVSDLIAKLEELKAKRGDVVVWCNGEFGNADMRPVDKHNIFDGPAHLYIDQDILAIRGDDRDGQIIFIGE